MWIFEGERDDRAIGQHALADEHRLLKLENIASPGILDRLQRLFPAGQLRAREPKRRGDESGAFSIADPLTEPRPGKFHDLGADRGGFGVKGDDRQGE